MNYTMDTNELTLYCMQAFSDPLQLSAFQHMTDGFAKIFLKVVVAWVENAVRY